MWAFVICHHIEIILIASFCLYPFQYVVPYFVLRQVSFIAGYMTGLVAWGRGPEISGHLPKLLHYLLPQSEYDQLLFNLPAQSEYFQLLFFHSQLLLHCDPQSDLTKLIFFFISSA